MNKARYKDTFYEMREIKDLKDMLNTSAELFADRTAYLVKDKPGGAYSPILYRQVKEDIDALGTKLQDMGLKGEKIAIIGENSYLWIVAYLAVVNGIGVVVPIDRELRPKEVRNLIERAEVSTIIHSKKMTKTVQQILKETEAVRYTICMNSEDISKDNSNTDNMHLESLIEEGKALLAAGDRRFLDAEIDGDALCSLLFTSGTTGLAKGVMLSHRNIIANVYNMSKYVKIEEDGIGLSVLPMHHAYEMTCHIFTGFYQGISVAICEGLKYILKNMSEAHATVMLSVPLVFESMHRKIWKRAEVSGKAERMRKMIAVSRKLKLYNNQRLVRAIFKDVHAVTGNNVQLFITGGAAINPKVIEDFEAMGFPMIQGYGMTENAPIIAVNRCSYSKADSVGPPLPGTEVRIVHTDQTGLGEIVCKGPSVMLGYYNDEEETQQVLKDGWLYTGDYGYVGKDGLLYVSGRKKNVIVTKNGKNIFPEEVEFYLTESEYIEEALVHGITDEKSGTTIIKAAIYPNYALLEEESRQMSEEEMKVFFKEIVDEINEQMPRYKHVKRFAIRKTEFDKTTTRKIKRYSEANLNEWYSAVDNGGV